MTLCPSTSWTSQTRLLCAGVTGTGKLLRVSVSVTSLVGTQLVAFSYDAPVVSYSAAFNSVVSGGNSLTVYGLNFAMNDVSNTAIVGVTACGTTSWSSVSAVRCLSPSGAGAAKTMIVEATSARQSLQRPCAFL